MELGFDRRLGIAGVILALAGIGIPLVWPDARWIGWVCLAAGAIGLAIWLIAEIRARINSKLSWGLSTLVVIVILGGLGLLFWNEPKAKKAESPVSSAAAVTSKPSAPEHPVVEGAPIVNPPAPKLPTAAEIAKAMEESTRVRDAFNLERDKPITSMYAIVSLIHPIAAAEVKDYAGVVAILSAPGSNAGSTLFFGFVPDKQVFKRLGNDEKLEYPGYRGEVWSRPKIETATNLTAVEPNMIDIHVSQKSRKKREGGFGAPESAFFVRWVADVALSCLSAVVPAWRRTGHPFAASGC